MKSILMLFAVLLVLTIQHSFGQINPEDSLARHKRFPAAADTVVKTQAEEIQQLKKDILRLDRELANTQLNLVYHYKEYKTGTFLKIGGAAVFALGIILAASNQRGHTRGTRTSLISPQTIAVPLIGVLSFVAGEILCFHSHKYIGRAGKRLKISMQ